MKYFFLLSILLLLTEQSSAQSNNAIVKTDTIPWFHQKTYDRLVQRKYFTKGMSDDEMAGILLYRGGNSLKATFFCELFGSVIVSLVPTIHPENQGARVAVAVTGTAFFVAGIVNLMSGYNKISKAGIILQHKGIKIKTTASGVSLNF